MALQEVDRFWARATDESGREVLIREVVDPDTPWEESPAEWARKACRLVTEYKYCQCVVIQSCRGFVVHPARELSEPPFAVRYICEDRPEYHSGKRDPGSASGVG